MRKLVVIIFLMFVSSFFCFSQDTVKPYEKIQHNLFVEIGGNSVYLYNLTYDCSYAFTEKHKIAVGAGVMYMPKFSWIVLDPIFGASVQVNFLYGKKHHYLETGTGISFPFAFEYYKNVWITNLDFFIPMRIGYRYQRSDGGLFWKIAFVPCIAPIGDYFLGKVIPIPSAGIAIGYTFKTKKH